MWIIDDAKMQNQKVLEAAGIDAEKKAASLIEKAKEMGYTTHVFAWASGDVGEKAADYFYPVSIVEKEQILEKCKEIGICGICTIASDLAAVTVNFVAEKSGLFGNSMECTLKSTNKHLMRETFERCGDPSPKSILVDENTDISSLELQYPVIVKPTDRSGSRGIFKLESKDGLADAIKSSMSEGFEKKALVEEFAEGKEYSVEGISFNGEHHILAMTEKFTTGAPHFIETGHLEPAPVSDEIFNKVKSVVKHALDSLGIKNSASHSELKIDKNGNIKIIEIGGRMGGDCIGSHLVKYSTGIDFVRAVVDVACGNAPDLSVRSNPHPARVKFIFTKEDLAEYEKIKDTEKFLDLISFTPENIDKTTDSSNRGGCYIIRE